jgi:hypothetical protein
VVRKPERELLICFHTRISRRETIMEVWPSKNFQVTI